MTTSKAQNTASAVPTAPPQLLSYSRSEAQPSVSAKGRKVWIAGPGATTWLVEGAKLLYQAYEALYDQKTNHVDWVCAHVDRAAKRLLVVPAQAEAADTAPVSTKRGKVLINLSSLLRKANLEVESGYSELFTVALDHETAVGTAVVVDMQVAEKRKVTAKKARRQVATVNLNTTSTK